MFFLDFDGVLFDTVREAYVVACITHKKYTNIDEVNFKDEHFKKFKQMRYLISPAWNYKYLLEELDINTDINLIQKNYLNKIQLAKKEDYKDFEDNFFNNRNYLKKNSYESWFRLNIPFPFLHQIEKLFYTYVDNLYIITTKDKSTVLKLLALEGIDFNADKIFDKNDYERFGNKKNIIEYLINNNIENIFIDDSDKHINDCKDIQGLKCFQPNWGYVSLDSQISDYEEILNYINKIIDRNFNV